MVIPTPTDRPGRVAFTLIELLVVISIVTVLAGMLLPAIAMVKRSANASKCASNLRQCSLALSSYAADSDGLLTYFTWVKATGSESTWPLLMYRGEYLESASAACCPDLPPMIGGNAINMYNGYGLRDDMSFNNRFLLYSIPSPKNYAADFVEILKLERLPKKSEYPLLADTRGTDPLMGTFGKQFTAWRSGGTWWGTDCNGVNQGMMNFRHTARLNVLYADGHVQSVDRVGITATLVAEQLPVCQAIWCVDAAGVVAKLH